MPEGQTYCYWCSPNRGEGALAPALGSEIPVPKCLEGIYTGLGRWQSYSPRTGYRKCPCMILHINGNIYGPCWPNAGKFVSLEGGQWLENGVAHVAYFTTDEEAQNKE